MHIIIVGCGKVGSRFAKVLSEEGHDVVIIDSDSNNFKALGPNFNGITITGVPIDQDVLKHAGIENADALAAVTPDDNVNIIACQVAKEIFKVPRVIARIYNPEREHVFHQFGLDTICPTNLTVDSIRSIILEGTEASRHIIDGLPFKFIKRKVMKPEEGKKLGSVEMNENKSIFGYVRKNVFHFYDPDVSLEKDDVLIIAEKIDVLE